MAFPGKIRFYCRFNRASRRAYTWIKYRWTPRDWEGVEKLVESESSRNQPRSRRRSETKVRGRKGQEGGTRRGITGNGSSSLRTVGSKQLNDKIYSSVARLPLALPEGRGGSSAKDSRELSVGYQGWK